MSQSPYSAEKLRVGDVDVVRLDDRAHKTEVSIAVSIGNNAYEMKVNGKNVLWSPYETAQQFHDHPTFLGIPFLEPWANRLDSDRYFANGHQYLLNPALGNFRYDQNHHPIHGLVSYTPEWKVISSGADKDSAWVTSRLEFWRYPDWMAQFPFAHTIEMTYRLSGGSLEVRTVIDNLSNAPMPLVIGYHPYFRIGETHRDSWTVHIAARDHVKLTADLIPTGEMEPLKLPDPLQLATTQLDDVFTNLIRGADGRADFWFQSGSERIWVKYGQKFKVAVIYAPPGKDFICFEPMTAITDAFNLAHQGKYKDLDSIAPKGRWEESFWIGTTGY